MNEDNQTPSCSRCGAPLTADALKGLCPRCLMALNLVAPTEIPGETGPHGTKVVKPPPALDEIARLFPQFEILECLGRGGMGVVYRARQPKLNRIVALKILAPEKVAEPRFAERFEREAQALARLNHPNIVTVYDFGETGGLYYLMMEFVDGVSLRQLLQTRKIAPEEALAIVPKICEALQSAHEQGVVHRDIKPENVLLDKQGRVKIADFGIAKIVADAGESPLVVPPSGGPGEASVDRLKPELQTLTQDQVLGTPNYMAPEQVEKPQLVDHRADIYSLGVVFYEMLTGELPLGKFQPPSKKVQVDVRLDEVVLHALEKEPERRYQQASQVKTDVETIAATPSSGSSGRESAPIEAARPPVAVTSRSNATEATIVFAGTGFFLFMLAVVAEMSLRAGPFRGFLIVICVIGLVICALSLAGVWPFPSPWFPEPNFSSRNLRRGEAAAGSDAALGRRFSRTAIVGACWGICALVAAVLWSPIGASTAVDLRAALGRGLVNGCIYLLTLFGIAAPFGTSILGSISVSQIRHSQGRLYGLGLAAFDALLFPLLALDALIVVLFKYLGAFIVHDFGLPHTVQLKTLFVLMVVCIVVLDWLIVRAVWRAVKKPLDGRNPETPRAPGRSSRVVRAGILAVAIAVLGVVVAAAFFSGRNETPATLAKSPQKLKSLPTATVIQAGLAEPGLPWAWNELKSRSETGRLKADEADTIVAELAAWMRREHPRGYDEPLHWLGGLLDELGRRRLVTDEKVLAFLEAFYGNPKCEPLFRVRETEPQPELSVTCRWRSPWNPELFGLKLLNEMRSIMMDGKEVKWRDVHANCDQYEFYGDLELPSLAPGNYTVRFEIESALIAKEDVVGLAPDTLSEDWPPAKRRWTRVCQSELIVYAETTEIVKLTEDAALDPVASGALSVKQIIIRSDSSRATAAVAVVVLEKDNSGQKLLVPISFDVSLRLSGETYHCGRFWSAARGTRAGFVPNSGSRSELSADIKPLSPEVQEAEVVLTPNPKAVEKEGSIDRIWGRAIVFPHVRLVRQDLRGADKPAFGAAIEVVLPFGAPCENHYLQFRSGQVFTIGRGPATTKEEYDEDWKRVEQAGGVDASAIRLKEGIQLVGEGCVFTLGHRLNWDTTTADEVIKQLEHTSWINGVVEPKTKDFPITYLFRTARGDSGLLQLLEVVEDQRGYAGSNKQGHGLKLRWKFVPSTLVSAASTETKAAAPRLFVRLVVDSDAMTFEGQPTTWDDQDQQHELTHIRPLSLACIAGRRRRL